MKEKMLKQFVEELGSAMPAPGGGGAAALSGALGTALCSMVANLTSGKQKYAVVQTDIERMLTEAQEISIRMLELIEEDENGFLPLADAYRLPANTPEECTHKEAVMEEALQVACKAPLEVMEQCCRALYLHREMEEKGSMMAISDVGAGAVLLQGALRAASLNIDINVRSLKNRKTAEELREKCNLLLQEGNTLADAIFASVQDRLR